MNQLSTKSLIAVNLIVAFVVIFQKWGYYSVLLIYWVEAMIIGLYGLGRMCVACWFGEPFGKRIGVKDGASRLALSLVLGGFYILKFGGFALGLGVLVALAPGFLADGASSQKWTEVTRGLNAVGAGVAIVAALLFISHGISFVSNFLRRREYKKSNVIVLLFGPYVRMILVLVVLAAGFGVTVIFPALYRTTAFAAGIVLVKLLADAVSHALEHHQPVSMDTHTAP